MRVFEYQVKYLVYRLLERVINIVYGSQFLIRQRIVITMSSEEYISIMYSKL